MAVRGLRFEGDPVLTQVATPITEFDDDLAALIRDMFETMYAAPGRGLAAPQVGVSQRVFVVDTTWKDADPAPMIFVNPAITDQSSDTALGTEACLSIPDKSYQVVRPTWVELSWQDLDGAAHQARFDGVEAVCICHENDHLDGRLISTTGVLM